MVLKCNTYIDRGGVNVIWEGALEHNTVLIGWRGEGGREGGGGGHDGWTKLLGKACKVVLVDNVVFLLYFVVHRFWHFINFCIASVLFPSCNK